MGRTLGLDVDRETHFLCECQGRRPGLVFRNWEFGKDLYVDVVGSSPMSVSNAGAFSHGNAAIHAVASSDSYRHILHVQRPSAAIIPLHLKLLKPQGFLGDPCSFADCGEFCCSEIMTE